MLNITLLRNEYKETFKKLSTRNFDLKQMEDFLKIDNEWRDLTTKIQKFNSEKNSLSKEIAVLVTANKKDEVKEITKRVLLIKTEIESLQKKINEIDLKIKDIMLNIPNVPHSSIPVGKDEKDNIEIKKWGKPQEFSFKFLPHWDLATKNNLIDFERSVKISGSRFVIYTGYGAKLVRALQQYTLDLNSDAGFLEILPPVVLNAESLKATGQLPKFEEDLFKLNNGKYLSPTAEVQLTNMYRGEILNFKNLPYYLTANTACFRSEAGSAGRDTRGVIRQHQFYKTEMVKIVKPETSYAELETMVEQAEKILETLNLPYRRIVLCTGDMGFSAAKTYDIEVWLPSYAGYKEISSCSNCEDFQAHRLMTRYKDEEGKTNFVHTLNGSGLAIDRLWAAVVENYQQPDGSIKVPQPLRKYLNNVEYIK